MRKLFEIVTILVIIPITAPTVDTYNFYFQKHPEKIAPAPAPADQSQDHQLQPHTLAPNASTDSLTELDSNTLPAPKIHDQANSIKGDTDTFGRFGLSLGYAKADFNYASIRSKTGYTGTATTFDGPVLTAKFDLSPRVGLQAGIGTLSLGELDSQVSFGGFAFRTLPLDWNLDLSLLARFVSATETYIKNKPSLGFGLGYKMSSSTAFNIESNWVRTEQISYIMAAMSFAFHF